MEGLLQLPSETEQLTGILRKNALLQRLGNSGQSRDWIIPVEVGPIGTVDQGVIGLHSFQ